MLSLHGAGSHGDAALPARLREWADTAGGLILAPDSRGRTWDVLLGGFDADVAFIDSALDMVFSRIRVDPGRVVISGFSDGASYALSVGLGNGDLFSHVMAFSPGFMAPDAEEGRPPIFVSHGTGDPVLNVEACSRALVPILEQVGYDVSYVEFPGGHEVPPEIIERALAWMERSSGSV